MKTYPALSSLVAALWAFLPPSVDAVTLVPLGHFPGGPSSAASGVSQDGGVAVGYSNHPTTDEAFRWTPSGGMVGLGYLPGGTYSDGRGVSNDGTVVVGDGDSSNGVEAFRWTQAGGMVGLGDLAGGTFESLALGLSGDGSVVVGSGNSASGYEAFRWTQSGGMVGLGDLPGGIFDSSANGVSGDGAVLVGNSHSASGLEAFLWTQTGGMVALGDLAGGAFLSVALGVSSDGAVVVGYGTSASGQEAFRWTQAGGMVGLGDLAGGTFESLAEAASGDGGVVVGYATSASGGEAFRWTQTDGMERLWDYLLSHGLNPADSGWTILKGASAVSTDGRWIAGYGTRNGASEAFLVDTEGFLLVDPTETPAQAAAREAGELLAYYNSIGQPLLGMSEYYNKLGLSLYYQFLANGDQANAEFNLYKNKGLSLKYLQLHRKKPKLGRYFEMLNLGIAYKKYWTLLGNPRKGQTFFVRYRNTAIAARG